MKPKLLIVEDDVALQQILSWDFEDLGYQVTAITDYRGARQALATDNFDLALVDYHLPDGKGSDLIDEIHIEHPDLSVVISSGLSCAQTAARAVERGAFKFVQKPARADVLHKVFQTALNRNKH